MAKPPDSGKRPSSGKTPKPPKSKAHRPDVQPIGPALADLLNPAINRGDAGMGSGTGLQPPPSNSKERRSGGEAAAHRARASTKPAEGLPPDRLADRNMGARTIAARKSPLRSNPQPTGARIADEPSFSSSEADSNQGFSEGPQREFAPANYNTAATIPTLDPELAKQLGFTTEEEDAALARPARNKMEALGVAATADALDALIRDGRPEFRGGRQDIGCRIALPVRKNRKAACDSSSSPNTSRRATSRSQSRNWSRASTATTVCRCCSASPAAARPTQWRR